MMPLLMFRFPIMVGFSFVESGLGELVEDFFSSVFFLLSLELSSLLAGSCEVCVWVVWAKIRIEPASSDVASNRAVAIREKLFISENLLILRNRPKREESSGTIIQRPLNVV
jgi:hypothetical protein